MKIERVRLLAKLGHGGERGEAAAAKGLVEMDTERARAAKISKTAF